MTPWIVASSEAELELLKRELKAQPFEASCLPGAYRGSLGDVEIHLRVVGFGVVSAAMALGGIPASERPDLLIMTGSAGALPGSGLDVGDVAVASSEILAELGVCTGVGMGDAEILGLSGLDQVIDLDAEQASTLAEVAGASFRVRGGPFLTVVGVSADRSQAAARADRFGTVVENMEGYAVALAGRRFGIPTGEVRAVSNLAGIRDKSAWNLPLANERAQVVVLDFLRRLL